VRTIPALVLVAILAACAATEPRDSNQPAIAAAIERGAKEMNCREATAKVLSRRAGTGGPSYGAERYEYTVGIEGCGKSMTSVVICSAGSCFVAGSNK
jgi:hypothetical protein